MDVLIIAEFCEDFSATDNSRFLYLANLLSDKNDVELVTSSFHHTSKSFRRKPNKEWPFKINFIEELGYPRNICLKRFLSHYIWGRNLIHFLNNRKKPDVIYCAVPSLTGAFLAAAYCKRNGIRFIIDIQDLWPEAFRIALNIPIISSLLFFPFKLIANSIYSKADDICAVSETYVNRALSVNKKCKQGLTVYLGTDLDVFDTYSCKTPIIDKARDEIWMTYAGTLGASYDLPLAFEAMKNIESDCFKFIVIGNGPQESEFKEAAKGLNVVFLGWMPYDQVCSILAVSDMVINPIVGDSVASIINKHADYSACGKPVINTQNSEEYRNLVDKYNMGINCDTSQDVSEAITFLINNPEIRQTMGRNARVCAEERFNRKTTYLSIVDNICNLK